MSHKLLFIKIQTACSYSSTGFRQNLFNVQNNISFE